MGCARQETKEPRRPHLVDANAEARAAARRQKLKVLEALAQLAPERVVLLERPAAHLVKHAVSEATDRVHFARLFRGDPHDPLDLLVRVGCHA